MDKKHYYEERYGIKFPVGEKGKEELAAEEVMGYLKCKASTFREAKNILLIVEAMLNDCKIG